MKNDIIMRKLLDKEFNYTLKFPFVIAIAPMGYGKTVSAVAFLNKNNVSSIWLSLETMQSSYQNIWDTFCRQIEKVDKILASKLKELGFPIDIKNRNHFFSIISDYINNRKTLIVIDDYHFAKSKEMDELLYHFIKADIENLHILILSRIMPEINIEELRVKDKCYIIKGDKFILTKAEVAKYFRVCRVAAPVEIIEKAYKISEGWISAVRLIAEKYHITGKIEPSSNIESLIKETVTSKYSKGQIDILTELSILDSFTLEQASYVLGVKKETISKVVKSNAFIRYDEINEDYKTHTILNEYLIKNHLKQIDNTNELYKRSGRWYIKNNQLIDGIKSFMNAKDYDSVVKEFEKNTSSALFVKHRKFMYETFAVIPDYYKMLYPIAYLNYVSFVITVIDVSEGIDLLIKLEDYYKNDIKTTKETKTLIAGEIEHLKGITEFNNIGNMVSRLKNAYYLLKGKSRISSTKKLVTLGSISLLFSYYVESGKLKFTAESIYENYRYYEMLTDGCGRGTNDLAMAEYYLEVLDIGKARLYAEKALLRSKKNSQLDIILLSNFILARIAAFEVDYKKSVDLILNIEKKQAIERHLTANSQYEICLSYIYCNINQYDNITNWIKEGDFKSSKLLFYSEGIHYIIHGKSLALNKEYIKLELYCEDMNNVMKRFNNLLGFLHTYILETIAKYNLYGIDSAIEPLKKALEIGENDNIYMLFIEYGTSLLEVIEKADLQSEYINNLTLNMEKHIEGLQKEKPTNDNLTSRENEIISLVLEGKSNKEISKTLFIAEVTVKKILSTIYKKLRVKNRRELFQKY